MRSKAIVLSAISGILLTGVSALQAQTPVASNRVAQQVVIRGQRADAVYVLAPTGGIQSYTCPSPEQYATPDGASQGWACYDAATSVWLLSALPPASQAPAPAQAPAVVQQPAQQQVYQPVQQPVVIQPVYQQPVYSPYYYSYYDPYPTVIYSSRGGYSSPYYYSRPTLSIGIGIGGRSSYNDRRVESRVVDNRGGRRR